MTPGPSEPTASLPAGKWVPPDASRETAETSPWLPDRRDPDRCAHIGGSRRETAGNPRADNAPDAAHRRREDAAVDSRRRRRARTPCPSAVPPRREIPELAAHAAERAQGFAPRPGRRASHRADPDRPANERTCSVRA